MNGEDIFWPPDVIVLDATDAVDGVVTVPYQRPPGPPIKKQDIWTNDPMSGNEGWEPDCPD